MEKKAPLKRHPALRHLSHDHHHGLLLCWKIRQGFKLGIEPKRVKIYCEWFWDSYLNAHFEEEEMVIFPILTDEDPMIRQALSEHRRLRKLFSAWENPEKTLGKIEEELEKHIRFEERSLFPLVQEKATALQLDAISKHGEKARFEENISDLFWIKLPS